MTRMANQFGEPIEVASSLPANMGVVTVNGRQIDLESAIANLRNPDGVGRWVDCDGDNLEAFIAEYDRVCALASELYEALLDVAQTQPRAKGAMERACSLIERINA